MSASPNDGMSAADCRDAEACAVGTPTDGTVEIGITALSATVAETTVGEDATVPSSKSITEVVTTA